MRGPVPYLYMARTKVRTSLSKPGVLVHTGVSVLWEAISRAVRTVRSSTATPDSPFRPSVRTMGPTLSRQPHWAAQMPAANTAATARRSRRGCVLMVSSQCPAGWPWLADLLGLFEATVGGRLDSGELARGPATDDGEPPARRFLAAVEPGENELEPGRRGPLLVKPAKQR